jgi:murein DD-endopeptidase MepM/ murein hydrolase activator NlpD
MREPLDPSSPNISLSPKLFAQDLSAWTSNLCSQTGEASGKSVLRTGYAVEHAKELIVASIRSRDSQLGRPFSPFGVGGLTAVIGITGLLFGHNGYVKDQLENRSVTPIVQAQTSNQVALVKSDLMVDNTDLHTVIPSDRLRDSVITHQIQSGETLESIAKNYNVSVDSLRYVNNLSSQDDIAPGQNLTILPISGVLHEVKNGETLQSIADAWKVPVQAIVDVNWLDEPYAVQIGQKLVIPGAEIPKPTPTPDSRSSTRNLADSAPAVKGSGMFIWPVPGQVTQYFSYYHNGIDIGNRGKSAPIVAAGSGVVTFAGWWNGGGGNSVWIDHGNGYVTMYAHMSKIMAAVGQRVTQGTQIGITGETGRAFGIHLHFMVEYHHKVLNPLSVL